MKVFLSYSRKDADFVARVERRLNALGYDVWVDTEDILAGGQARWRRTIVAAIRESEVMVLVLSSNSTNSENVERELSVAADNAKRVIPVMYQECELPDGFQYDLAGVQRIDFTKADFEDGVQQLSEYLGPPRAVTPPVAANAAQLPPLPPPAFRTLRRWRRPRALALAGATAAVLLTGGIVIAAAIGGDGSSATTPPATAPTSGVTTTPTTTATTTPTATTTATTTPTSTTESATSVATPISGPSVAAAPPRPTEQAPAAPPVQTVCIRSDINFAALREAPDLAANMLAQIPPGSCDVILVDPTPVQGSGFEWTHVQWSGIDGWTASSNTA
jgi:TIR domain